MDTEVVWEIEAQGAADVEEKRAELVEGYGKVFGKVRQDLQIEDYRV